MTGHLSLPPAVEQLVREQLATGRFQDESDVLATAMRLLGERSQTPKSARDAAFGLWKDRGEDGLAYQRHIRAEWSR